MAHTRFTIAILALLTAMSVGSLSAQDENRRYGYIRLLEGRASVLEPGSTDEIEAEEQSPLLTSDRLRVGRSSRLEAVLADLSHLRLFVVVHAESHRRPGLDEHPPAVWQQFRLGPG